MSSARTGNTPGRSRQSGTRGKYGVHDRYGLVLTAVRVSDDETKRPRRRLLGRSLGRETEDARGRSESPRQTMPHDWRAPYIDSGTLNVHNATGC